MGLNFATTSDQVTHGSAATIDDIAPLTLIFWVKITSLTGTHKIWQKGYVSAHGTYHHLFLTTTNLSAERNFSPTFLQLDASLSNFAYWGTNKWVCIVMVHSTSGVATDQHLFVGDRNNNVAGPSSYATRQASSGSIVSDAAADFIVGQRGGGSQNVIGDIAVCIAYNSALTQAQIIQQQWNIWYPLFSNCKVFCNYGFNGTGSQPDLSGNAHNGTVTGATVAPHVPLPQVYVPSFKVTAAPAGRTTKNTDTHPLGIHTAMSWRLPTSI